MLYPYDGRMPKYRFESDGKGASQTATFPRTGETRTISFNSLGYRGEEFDPDAPLKLFACGCSFTLGLGLEHEESWPYLFKQKLAKQLGLPDSSVNLMNFSEGGGSNDYIARTLVGQAGRVRPDVIVAGFTHMVRFELLGETTAFPFYGPWDLEVLEARYGEIAKLGEFVFLGTDEIGEKVRLMKNLLLLQYFCRSHDIPFVFFLFESLKRDDLPAALAHPTTQPLYDEVDFSCLAPIEAGMKVDVAADGWHPGPRSHELFVESAWKTFSARYPQFSLAR
jgi:hypothetical protein